MRLNGCCWLSAWRWRRATVVHADMSNMLLAMMQSRIVTPQRAMLSHGIARALREMAIERQYMLPRIHAGVVTSQAGLAMRHWSCVSRCASHLLAAIIVWLLLVSIYTVLIGFVTLAWLRHASAIIITRIHWRCYADWR